MFDDIVLFKIPIRIDTCSSLPTSHITSSYLTLVSYLSLHVSSTTNYNIQRKNMKLTKIIFPLSTLVFLVLSFPVISTSTLKILLLPSQKIAGLTSTSTTNKGLGGIIFGGSQRAARVVVVD